ncbi:MAG: alpha/beta fold hydrolase [Nitrosomonadales bacterium]|nr:alpha/beta fold hydrolase [Nitrosomonadales bacterium]
MDNTDWIDRDEYPFASHHLQTAAGKLHYVDEGSGETVVMLHGNPAWSFLYRKLIKRLSPSYRCIAPDHIGFGLSDKPTDWSYLPEQHAKNLAALIGHLGLKDITLVVNDWGGPIGMHYAVNHPHNVKRLVVLNTWAWPVDDDFHYVAFSAFMGGPIGRFLIRHFNFFVTSFMRVAFGDKSKLGAHAHRHYRAALPTAASRKGCYVFPGQIIGSTPWLRQIWEKMSALKDKPTLFVWGMKDVAFREQELKRWQQALPNSITLRLGSVGHFVAEEAPEQLGEAVENFLKEQTRG